MIQRAGDVRSVASRRPRRRLRDDARSDPEVLAYLQAENAWATQCHHDGAIERLEGEMRAEMDGRWGCLPDAWQHVCRWAAGGGPAGCHKARP